MARFTNQAQLRYGNNVANSNIAVGEILEVLSATKTAVKNTYNQNDTITYVVSIVNSGNTAINGLTLSDNLGAYTFNTNTLVPLTYVNNTAKYYTNGTLQAAPAVTQGPPLSITGINVPAGGNATVIYEAALNEYAPLGIEAAVTNTATVSGTGITPVTAAETVNAEAAPNLAITKSVSPVPVTENGTLTYTFRIQNYGSVAATNTTGVVITDTFAPVLQLQIIPTMRRQAHFRALQVQSPFRRKHTHRIALPERGLSHRVRAHLSSQEPCSSRDD